MRNKKTEILDGSESIEPTEPTENAAENIETGSDTNHVDTQQNLIEDIARTQGWTDEESFNDDPENSGKNWKPAVDYLRAAPLVDRIKIQNNDIKELKSMNEAVLKMLQNQTEKSIQERAEKILQEKRTAIEEGNISKTEELEKQYHETLKEIPEQSVSSENSEILPEYREFAQENKGWFNNTSAKNKEMSSFAIAFNNTLETMHPGLSVTERLVKVKKAVMIEFPENFENPNRNKVGIVEKNTPTISTKHNITYNDLPFEARQIIDTFVTKMKFKDKNLDITAYRNKYAKELLDSGAVQL